MAAYYNEIEPYAAQWLRNLIKAGHIADGEVDTRSIVDVSPDDVRGFTQAHFFAGIGGWSHALRLSGWPDHRKIWTGSCPCQPFSVAGKGAGIDDPRHLWPHFFRLIAAVRPPVVMGEQVAGSAGYGWFDGVRADLEAEGYASRGVDIPACAVDAPHIRSRLYWVASDVADAHDRNAGQPRDARATAGARSAHGPDADLGSDVGDADGSRSAAGIPAQDGGQQRVSKEPDDGSCRPSWARGKRPTSNDSDVADANDAQRGADGAGGHQHDGRQAGRIQGAGDPARGSAGDVADADSSDIQARGSDRLGAGAGRSCDGPVARCRDDDHLGDVADAKQFGDRAEVGAAGDGAPQGDRPADQHSRRGGAPVQGDVADAAHIGRKEWEWQNREQDAGSSHQSRVDVAGNSSFWSGAVWLTGSDGKARRAQPGIPLLAHGIPNRVGKLRAYGNAIVPPLAAQVIGAYLDAEKEIKARLNQSK